MPAFGVVSSFRSAPNALACGSLSKKEWFALVPTPEPRIARLDRFAIGRTLAETYHRGASRTTSKRVIDTWVVTDADLHNVRMEKPNILLIGPSDSVRSDLFSGSR
jgi:hypothetical protein